MTTRQSPRDSAIESVLVRSRRRCALCYLSGDAEPKEGTVAFIVPRNQGGKASPENLVYLCANHHVELDQGTPSAEYVTFARERLYGAVEQPQHAKPSSRPRVFIAHGRDDALRGKLVAFLQSKGIEPVDITEQPNMGRVIPEKLEGTGDIQYAIALFTPDEWSSGLTGMYSPVARPRQNVLFEFGYFIGRLGRNRVCALYRPGIELPSDFHGAQFIPIDAEGHWEISLTKELLSAGLPLISS